METQLQQEQPTDPNTQNYSSIPIQSTSDAHKNSGVKFILLLLATLIVFICGFYAYKTFFVKPIIVGSYDECIETEGSLIQETYPQVCITKNGLRFTQKVPPITTLPLTTAEECYNQIVNDSCPEGAECLRTDPAYSFCTCVGGSVETIEANTLSEDKACVVNGEVYSGINFLELDHGWYWADSDQKKIGTPANWILENGGSRSACWHKPGAQCIIPLPD